MAQTIEVGTRPVEGSVRDNQETIGVDMGPAAGRENDSAAEVELKPNVRSGITVKIDRNFAMSSFVGVH